MVNRELIEVFSEIAREKNVERSELATILEELFLYVIEKEYGDSSNCSCIVNLDKGEIEIYAEKTIVEEIDDYKVEITMEDAIEKEPDASDLEVGDVFVEVIDPRMFGRRLVITAKQFFAQRLRDVERNYIYEDYANRVGEIVIGVVHQVQRDGIFINIEQAELRMPKSEQIHSERYRRGETVRAVAASNVGQANSAQIEDLDSKVDLLTKLISNSLSELDDHKDNLSEIDSKKELDFKDRLIDCEKLILPLLQNLMKNEEKEYIYWPNRRAIIQSQIDRLQKITRTS